jgi:hypothetical protein
MGRERSLIASAKHFLIEALQNHSDHKYTFAILHAVTATELLLKERLSQIHPNLIFRNLDAPGFSKERTVALNNLPQRLVNLGVYFKPEEAELIATFAEWRNQVVHHMPSFDEKLAERRLPRLLDFLALFLRRELNTPLEAFLPKRLYRTASSLLRDWERVIQEARTRAEGEGNVLAEACPACGATGVLCLRGEGRVYCHLCGAKHYRYDRCTHCGRQTVSTFSSYDEENYCDDCLQAIGEDYAQMMLDRERGK